VHRGRAAHATSLSSWSAPAGWLTPQTLPPGRAIDLGCGSGANAIFLAENGFTVTGVDFSSVAIAKAQAAAASRHVSNLTFLEADLTQPHIQRTLGEFDLLVDYGTLDDLRREKRATMARNIVQLSRPGARFLLWCFYDEVPWWRRRRARFPGMKPGEEKALFAATFDIERLGQPEQGSGFACFLMIRHGSP
jgi:cyclopropane fatty-acyl-phospholipid synthase-like methyltransferase